MIKPRRIRRPKSGPNPFQRNKLLRKTRLINAQPEKPDPSRSTGKMGEYIDFEEIK